MRTHVVGGLFGGSRAAIDDLAREYDEMLAALLAADHLGTEENVLSVLYHRRPELYSLEPFTTWYHEDSGRLRPGDDSDSFFRIFERLAPQRNIHRVARRRRADVTVILNTYKRPHTLRQQYEAVVGQSCIPAEVFVWQNHPAYGQEVEVEPSTFDEDVLDRCVTVKSVNTNFGVWGRFAFALNARTAYVCVLDDDTIPGARWCSRTVSRPCARTAGFSARSGSCTTARDPSPSIVAWDGARPTRTSRRWTTLDTHGSSSGNG